MVFTREGGGTSCSRGRLHSGWHRAWLRTLSGLCAHDASPASSQIRRKKGRDTRGPRRSQEKIQTPPSSRPTAAGAVCRPPLPGRRREMTSERPYLGTCQAGCHHLGRRGPRVPASEAGEGPTVDGHLPPLEGAPLQGGPGLLFLPFRLSPGRVSRLRLPACPFRCPLHARK